MAVISAGPAGRWVGVRGGGVAATPGRSASTRVGGVGRAAWRGVTCVGPCGGWAGCGAGRVRPRGVRVAALVDPEDMDSEEDSGGFDDEGEGFGGGLGVDLDLEDEETGHAGSWEEGMLGGMGLDEAHGEPEDPVSGYRGVRPLAAGMAGLGLARWRVEYTSTAGAHPVFVGEYEDVTEAALAYDRAVRRLAGPMDSSLLNFPDVEDWPSIGECYPAVYRPWEVPYEGEPALEAADLGVRFGVEGQVSFEGEGDALRARLRHPTGAEAVIRLKGARLESFVTQGGEALLGEVGVSPCFPRAAGERPAERGLSVETDWKVFRCMRATGEDTLKRYPELREGPTLSLGIDGDDIPQAWRADWPHAFTATLKVTVHADAVELEMQVANCNPLPPDGRRLPGELVEGEDDDMKTIFSVLAQQEANGGGGSMDEEAGAFDFTAGVEAALRARGDIAGASLAGLQDTAYLEGDTPGVDEREGVPLGEPTDRIYIDVARERAPDDDRPWPLDLVMSEGGGEGAPERIVSVHGEGWGDVAVRGPLEGGAVAVTLAKVASPVTLLPGEAWVATTEIRLGTREEQIDHDAAPGIRITNEELAEYHLSDSMAGVYDSRGVRVPQWLMRARNKFLQLPGFAQRDE